MLAFSSPQNPSGSTRERSPHSSHCSTPLANHSRAVPRVTRDEEIANGPKEDMDLELLKRLSSEKPVVLEESKGKGKAPPPPPP
ncbi:unnamed protein product, partial [Darwinula stevensoni]